jgi:lipopolysaccharide/colanic/teichoic acid biosynthesis glycosyltransferase
LTTKSSSNVVDGVQPCNARADVHELSPVRVAEPASDAGHARGIHDGAPKSLRVRRLTRLRARLRRDPSQGSAIIGEMAGVLADGPALPGSQAAAIGSASRVLRHGGRSPCPSWKRAMDVVGAVLVLILMSPLLLGIAAWVKCVSRGPVFFRQRRIGVDGRPFTLWKFRTIEVSDAPAVHLAHISRLMASDQPLVKVDRRLAVIPGGRVLRSLGLDELPQLVNVLRGDMSLVGPRPDVIPYDNYEPWQRSRFDVLPGITGLWQVSGKNHTTFAEMMDLDIEYVRRRTVLLDLKILAKTVPTVLRG